MTEDEKTVTDTDAPEGDKAESDAQESYDELLKDFSNSEEPKPEPTVSEDADVKAQLAEINRKQDEFQRQTVATQQRDAVTGFVDRVKENPNLAHLSDTMIKGFLHAKNEEDTRIGVAFGSQFTKPSEWGAVEKRLIADMEQEYSSLANPILTADREAAEAAVRGVSNSPPQHPGRKSAKEEAAMAFNDPREWEKYKREIAAQPQE